MTTPISDLSTTWLRLASRRLIEHSIPHSHETRSALVYVPQHVRRRGGLPLVLAFHSGASSAELMAQQTNLHRIAEREGFLVAYPRGTRGRSGLTWVPSGRDRARRTGDVAFVRSLIADLRDKYDVDSTRIYAVGFSIGGSLVYELARVLGDRLAAVAVVAGTMATAYFDPIRPVPVLHIHGSNDRHVPFEGGRGPATTGTKEWLPVQDCIARWRDFNGCTDPPAVKRFGLRGLTSYTYSGAADIELWIIEGGGHSWPGAPRELKPDDTDSTAPILFSASETIWTFFAAHPRRPSMRKVEIPQGR